MNRIDQRLIRLRSHPNLFALFETLPFHTQRIIEGVLETGVTFPLMEQASQCMDEEFTENTILQILANGNVLRLDGVTEVALDEIEFLLESVHDNDV
jgi:hypothetical protein